MTMRDIVGRISNQPAKCAFPECDCHLPCGNVRSPSSLFPNVVAEDNGMVKTPVVHHLGSDAHPDRPTVSHAAGEGSIPSTGFTADLSLSQSGILSKQYALICDRLAELDTLRKGVVMLIERMKVLEEQNSVAQANERALADQMRDLATENAELRNWLIELQSDLDVARALKEVNEHDAQKRAEFDRQHPTDDDLTW